MDNNKIINYLGSALMLFSFYLAWTWFGWKLTLILFIALTANNMERYGK